MKILNLSKFRPRSDNTYIIKKKKKLFSLMYPQLVLLLMCVARDKETKRQKI